MKSIMAKYNYSFGYLKAFIFMDFGFAGIAAIFIGLISPFVNSGIGLAGLIYVPMGALLLLIASLVFRSSLKKCPAGYNNPVSLAIWMVIAGLLACFAFAWWFFKKIVFPIIGMNAGSGSAGNYKYAQRYSTESVGHGEEWILYETFDTYAVLGNNTKRINVHPIDPNASNGLVVDESNNTYYPR